MYKAAPVIEVAALTVQICCSGKWTVRRLRRRARTSSLRHLQSDKERGDREEKEEDSSRPSRTNVETILFGETLGKHHVASVELDSDQESTDGETEVGEEEVVEDRRKSADNEDDLSKLTPNSLLYR